MGEASRVPNVRVAMPVRSRIQDLCPRAKVLESYVLQQLGRQEAAAVRAHVLRCPRCSRVLVRLLIFYDLLLERLSQPIAEEALRAGLGLMGCRFAVSRLRFRRAGSLEARNGGYLFVRSNNGSEGQPAGPNGGDEIILSVFTLNDGRGYLTYLLKTQGRVQAKSLALPGSQVRLVLDAQRLLTVPPDVVRMLQAAPAILLEMTSQDDPSA
jgi:hypothetical protein